MSIATKSKYLATGVLAATLTFSPLLNGLSEKTIAFAEGDDDTQVEVVEATDNGDNADADAATQSDGDDDSGTPLVYGGESLSEWEYTENTVDSSVTLNAYKGTATDIIIPGELDGKQVKINSFDMLKNRGMTSLKVEETKGKKVVYVRDSLERAFADNQSVKSIDLSGLDVSNVNDMSSAFNNAQNLESCIFNGWETSNANSFNRMFAKCLSLKSLDLSSFTTDKVEDMEAMFGRCESLAELNISNFNTSNVLSFCAMFAECGSIRNLDLSCFDTSSATTFYGMFFLTSIHYLDLSSFVVNFDDSDELLYMFDLATNADGNITELPTAIIAKDPKLKALEQDSKLGNGRIPYQTSVTFNEDGAATQAEDEANGTIISAGKIFFDSVDEFKEATKVTPEDIAKVKENPTKDGYTFTGWYTDAATTQVFDGHEMTGSDDELTLYAGWSKNEEPIVDPTPGDNDNPGTGITDGDNNEQAGFDDDANADEADGSVTTSAPKTGDMTYLVVFSVLGVALLAAGTFVFARKRR